MKAIIAATVLGLSSIAFAGANPFQLTNLAYQGYLKNQGIPAYDAFCSEALGNPKSLAEEVVAAGVAAGRVSKAQATDAGYVRAVVLQVRGLCRD